jgi:Fic family protein
MDMGIDDKRLRAFVRESNAIEGITRKPRDAEVEAHRAFLKLEAPTVAGLVALVAVLQPNAELRDRPEVDGVQVGDHVAPPSGPLIRAVLEDILEAASDLDGEDTPYSVHLSYETLHPFTDGNGRSGRALWLWQMLETGKPEWTLGFLHAWYYQSLSGGRG